MRGIPSLLSPVAGACFALLCLEFLIRQVYCRREVLEPGYGIVPAPGSTVVWGTEGRGRSHWIEHGIRRPAPPPAGEPALLVLGDSQTEAFMIDDDDVFTGLVEAQLRKANDKIRVLLNAGHASASTADYVAYADRFERLFAPRWVFVILQEADLLYDAFQRTKPHFSRTREGALEAVIVPPPRRSRLGSLLWLLRQQSMLVGYGAVRVGQFLAASEPPLFSAGLTHPAERKAPDYPVEEELERVRSAYHDRVAFLLLSSFDPSAPERPTPLELRFLAHCREARLHCATPRDSFEEIAREGRAPYGHPNSRFNYGHLNRTGHQAVAKALLRQIRELEADGLL